MRKSASGTFSSGHILAYISFRQNFWVQGGGIAIKETKGGANRCKESAPQGLQFDYAVSSNVVEHTPNTIKWISDIVEVLKPRGVLLLIVPNKNASMDKSSQNQCRRSCRRLASRHLHPVPEASL
jgi:SAM-dependent methyltransferase